MTGQFDLLRGAGDVALIQQMGETRPNVSHFYGEEAVKQAQNAIRDGTVGFRVSFVTVGGKRLTLDQILSLQ